jgi:hypothetical protein
VDPVASLRVAEIDVEIGDYLYTVPALTAADWIEVLDAGSGWSVIPGLLSPQDKLSVMRDYLSGAVTSQGLLDAGRRVLEVAGGRKWWEVQRLVDSATTAAAWPTVHGNLVWKGVDLDRVTLAGFCNVIWVMGLQGCQKDSERQALEWEITKPPPGFADELEETDEADFNQILAEQARLTGG